MSTMLLDIYSIHKKQVSCNGFVIIGHPKNFSNVSIRNVEEFILEMFPGIFTNYRMLKKFDSDLSVQFVIPIQLCGLRK